MISRRSTWLERIILKVNTLGQQFEVDVVAAITKAAVLAKEGRVI